MYLLIFRLSSHYFLLSSFSSSALAISTSLHFLWHIFFLDNPISLQNLTCYSLDWVLVVYAWNSQIGCRHGHHQLSYNNIHNLPPNWNISVVLKNIIGSIPQKCLTDNRDEAANKHDRLVSPPVLRPLPVVSREREREREKERERERERERKKEITHLKESC